MVEGVDPILMELRLIRWHLEFQVRIANKEQEWRKYLELVDDHGYVRSYLQVLADNPEKYLRP